MTIKLLLTCILYVELILQCSGDNLWLCYRMSKFLQELDPGKYLRKILKEAAYQDLKESVSAPYNFN